MHSFVATDCDWAVVAFFREMLKKTTKSVPFQAKTCRSQTPRESAELLLLNLGFQRKSLWSLMDLLPAQEIYYLPRRSGLMETGMKEALMVIASAWSVAFIVLFLASVTTAPQAELSP
jgi:hypothetical protein